MPDPLTVKPLVSQTPSSAPNRPVFREMIPGPKTETFSTPKVKPSKKLVRFSSSVIKKSGDGGRKELTESKTSGEEKNDSYIDHTNMKMMVSSDISGGSAIFRGESFNDMFSSYVSRTKLRLRTSSSVGTSN
ncbi:hypothetical protein L1987_13133 [Smallanthus sonchifolius]|uniref:Uncharacterized protein n=1 Tax=Smallanthus sonchifolius TaxID=185202 RepID=A0ACB9JGM0_9ASTR|nr:hypothetical protein L1987_13133 [Smallanthus sonchifolius]